MKPHSTYALMTEAMEDALRSSPTAFLILAKLRRVVGEGNAITLTGGVRGWATWLGCSNGYPKTLLDTLATHGFIERTYTDGNVTIRVLPVEHTT